MYICMELHMLEEVKKKYVFLTVIFMISIPDLIKKQLIYFILLTKVKICCPMLFDNITGSFLNYKIKKNACMTLYSHSSNYQFFSISGII
jgi:hypothetical protein